MNLYINEPKSITDNTVKKPQCYSSHRKPNALETSAAFTDPTFHQNMFNRMVKMIHLGKRKQNGKLNFSPHTQ